MLISCSRPVSDEIYLKATDHDELGRYCFELSMDDQAYSYDIDIMLSYALERDVQLDFSNSQALIEFVAPSAARYEHLYDFSGNYTGQENSFTKTCMYRYAQGLDPVEYGKWMMRITLPEEMRDIYNLNGIGIRLIRNGAR